MPVIHFLDKRSPSQVVPSVAAQDGPKVVSILGLVKELSHTCEATEHLPNHSRYSYQAPVPHHHRSELSDLPEPRVSEVNHLSKRLNIPQARRPTLTYGSTQGRVHDVVKQVLRFLTLEHSWGFSYELLTGLTQCGCSRYPMTRHCYTSAKVVQVVL